MSKLPAIQFYPGDWKKDPGIRALTFEERGIWLELLFLMHDSEQRGKLLLGGKPYPEDRLAIALGTDVLLIRKVISNLITLNVASLCPKTGALMCRRMVRDQEISEIRARSGKMGGNPQFEQGKPNPYYNQTDKQKDNQNITPSSLPSSSISFSSTKTPTKLAKRKQTNPKPKMTRPQIELVQRFEACLDGEWTNDAGKWIKRVKDHFDKCERVISEVENAAKEKRIRTTPARYAEFTWEDFK